MSQPNIMKIDVIYVKKFNEDLAKNQYLKSIWKMVLQYPFIECSTY